MPYSKSRARQEFEGTHRNLFSLAKQVSYKKVPLSYDHKNMIFQSSVVLLCSSIEEYLRVFIEDLFHTYKVKEAQLFELPLNPRTFALYYNQRIIYENYIQNRNEAQLLDRLKVSNKALYSILDETQKLNKHIDSKNIVNDKKYPSPKNLKVLFNRIGIKNIFAETNRLGQKEYDLIIRSFLDVRETIAHQQSMQLTFEDVKRNFGNIHDFIDKVDRVSYQFICKVSGQKYWK